MTNYQEYSILHEFIETFLPDGFNKVDSNHPMMFDLEYMMERNNQFFFIADLFQGRILFTSKRSVDMIGVESKKLNPYHTIVAAHPDEVHRNTKGWAKLICMANDLFVAKGGCSLLSTNIKLLNPQGEYAETLFQCYLFYSEIPHKTVYLLQVHTNIDWYKKFKWGFHYYLGNDRSLFKYPDEALLKLGNDLTKREFEILKLVEAGLSTEKIAEKLFLSAYTINTHRGNILKKSGKAHISNLIYEMMDDGKL